MIDLWFQNFPLTTFGNEKSRFYFKDFLSTNIEHSIKIIGNDDYNVDNLNILIIELFNRHLDTTKDLVSINNFITQNPNLCIVFYYPSEGFTSDFSYRKLFETLTKSVKNINNTVAVVFGNHNIEKSYNKFLADKNYPKRFKVFSIDYFRNEAVELANNINLLDRTYDKINYDFLCLNRIARYNRIALYTELKRKGLLENNLVSYHNIKNNSLSEDNLRFAENLVDNEYSSLLKNSLNDKIILDNIGNYLDPYLVNEKYYRETFFSLITETEIDDLFLTEKTYKPILFGHPFIIWGSCGVLEYLRSKGFKTYEGIFNETYDTIKDNKQRLEAIIKELERYKNLNTKKKIKNFEKSKEIARHNRYNMLNNTKKDYLNSWIKILLGLK